MYRLLACRFLPFKEFGDLDEGRECDFEPVAHKIAEHKNVKAGIGRTRSDCVVFGTLEGLVKQCNQLCWDMVLIRCNPKPKSWVIPPFRFVQ